MDLEIFRDYCISLPGTTEHLPFDNDTLVFKVGGKLFALCSLQSFVSINLKCDPELAIELREQYADVIPGYHMNKKHWNTVSCDGSISDKLILEWTNDSYNLVLNSLPIRIRKEINQNQ